MSDISAELSRSVFARANHRCEYCLIPSGYTFQRHQIDHIRPRKHDGISSSDNLCLSCYLCNLYKGSDIAGYDPFSNELSRLFNPRLDQWADHFRIRDGYIDGVTPIGRTTIKLLRMNGEARVLLRKALLSKGLYP
jgi:hypothetical protein